MTSVKLQAVYIIPATLERLPQSMEARDRLTIYRKRLGGNFLLTESRVRFKTTPVVYLGGIIYQVNLLGIEEKRDTAKT